MKISLVAIKPKKTKAFDFAALMNTQLDAEALEIKKDLEGLVSTWKHKPKFTIGRVLATRTVGTNDKIFEYVDEGTRPHIIRPVKAKALRFNTKFKSKSVPNRFIARPGASSPPVAYAQVVHHPGTQARGFIKLVSKRSQARVGRRFQTAINKAVAQ